MYIDAVYCYWPSSAQQKVTIIGAVKMELCSNEIIQFLTGGAAWHTLTYIIVMNRLCILLIVVVVS